MKDRQKIFAIDIRLLGKGRTGDEAVFFHLTKELLALDEDNSAHAYRLLTDVRAPEKLALLQARLGCVGQSSVQIISLYGRNRFLWNLITLPWFLCFQHIDVYHTQYILPVWIPKRTKIVLHIHDVSFAAYPKLIGFFDRLFLGLLIPRSLRRAAAILTPSQFTKDEITRYYATAPEKITLVPNALGEEFGLASDLAVAAVRKKYQLPAQYILSVGTLQPRKNIPFLIRAFAILRTRLPEARLVIVGNREAHHVDPGLEEALRESGAATNVLFPGYIEEQDLPAVMRGARVFVFPSLYEGFGIPLLEAMSQAVPVAASRIPCLQEVAGEGAVYFDPTALAHCAETLYTLFTDEDLRKDTVQKGKERLFLFSWPQSARRLLKTYETLV